MSIIDGIATGGRRLAGVLGRRREALGGVVRIADADGQLQTLDPRDPQACELQRAAAQMVAAVRGTDQA